MAHYQLSFSNTDAGKGKDNIYQSHQLGTTIETNTGQVVVLSPPHRTIPRHNAHENDRCQEGGEEISSWIVRETETTFKHQCWVKLSLNISVGLPTMDYVDGYDSDRPYDERVVDPRIEFAEESPRT